MPVLQKYRRYCDINNPEHNPSNTKQCLLKSCIAECDMLTYCVSLLLSFISNNHIFSTRTALPIVLVLSLMYNLQ